MATPVTPAAPPPRKVAGSLIGLIWRNYYLRRLVKAVFTIFLVTTLTFFLIRLMPGNPLDIYINSQLAQGVPYQEAVEMANSIYQIDLGKPVVLQYTEYLGRLARGDFGKSIISANTPVSAMILRFLPWTLFVVMISLIISFSGGLLLGVLSAYRRNSWFDHALSTFSAVVSAVPNYVVGLLILVYFGVRWKFFDVAAVRGSLSPGVEPGWSLAFLIDALYHAALPITTYVLTTIGQWILSMKASTISTLGEDYVTVARARGLSDGRITLAYVGRNAVLPLFTQLALAIGFVVGGSVLIELVFTYQGIGLKLSSALTSRDYPVIQAIFIIITAAVIGAQLLADLLYSWLDPRIRVEGR